ncbi:hypothetical protein M409DRAFT_26220 [Zasmidium cellare ATCC 36951]|uniref:Uncharacterized protein n=1 Tax=Zasmidium cellare ATCC 36951 TaxID=1080233 RepID=A0A6A6CCG9_ZASCE|nr:uncharacterized protein M409DRAFT_26220 [Zasmidium cellare ATCC 36951]KAF2163612.1 hypothetical protein M409DRAFT_26220 [Zasmidium cellare ATCC 36951]
MNKAIIPNPENQIFQKAANFAGWFVPGSAGIGLMAGQIGVGIGAAFGHASMVAKTLSKANLELFIPKGLEICIGHTKDLNNETGVSASSGGFRGSNDPETRLAEYGNSVAPLSVVYPRQQNIGRQDPIAMLARGIGSRDNQKKIGKANKDAQKGKKSKKGDSLEGDVKWLMVRKATPDSVAHWKQTLRQSEAALAEERAQANGR